MIIRAGYDIAFHCQQQTPMVLMLSVHPSRKGDLLSEHRIELSGGLASRDYIDTFGNVFVGGLATILDGIKRIERTYLVEILE